MCDAVYGGLVQASMDQAPADMPRVFWGKFGFKNTKNSLLVIQHSLLFY